MTRETLTKRMHPGTFFRFSLAAEERLKDYETRYEIEKFPLCACSIAEHLAVIVSTICIRSGLIFEKYVINTFKDTGAVIKSFSIDLNT